METKMRRIPLSELSQFVGQFIFADCEGELKEYNVCRQNLSNQIFLLDHSNVIHTPNIENWVLYVDTEEEE